MHFSGRFLVLVVLVLSSQVAKGDDHATLRFDASGSSESIPFYTGFDLLPGIVHESVIMILEQAGITPAPIELPPKRTLMALKQGELDFHVMSLDWFPDGDYDPEHYAMSDPFLRVQEYVIAHPDTFGSGIPEDFTIHGKRVGTIAGYFYHDQNEFERVDFPSEQTLIKALELHRVSFAVIGTLPAMYWSKELNIPIAWVHEHSLGQLRLRIRKDKAHLLPAINDAIQTLDSSGKFADIENKYRDAFAIDAMRGPQNQGH